MPMTVENAAALVSGQALQAGQRQVLVLRAFMFGGQPVLAETTATLPAGFAAEMIAAGKAAPAPEPALAQTPAPEPAPEPAPAPTPAPAPAAGAKATK